MRRKSLRSHWAAWAVLLVSIVAVSGPAMSNAAREAGILSVLI